MIEILTATPKEDGKGFEHIVVTCPEKAPDRAFVFHNITIDIVPGEGKSAFDFSVENVEVLSMKDARGLEEPAQDIVDAVWDLLIDTMVTGLEEAIENDLNTPLEDSNITDNQGHNGTVENKEANNED